MAFLTRVPLKAVVLAAALAVSGCGLGRDSAGDESGVRDPIVAATVNGRPIYNEEVRAFAVSQGWIAETEDLAGDSAAASMALEELIRIRLFAMEAEARGLDRRPDVRRQIENMRERVLAMAIYEEIDQAATNPETIERLYRENSSRLGRGDEVRLRHMMFSTREAADAAKRRLDQGERFEALAFELSVARNSAPDGGDMGFVEVADLRPQLRQEIERTATGQLIGPIQIEDTWNIFRIDDRRTIGGRSLEELRPEIITWLRWEETTKLHDRLARDARIERLREDEDEGMAPAGEVTAPADAAPAQAPRQTAPDTPQTGAPPPPFPFPNVTAQQQTTTSTTPAQQQPPQQQTPPPATTTTTPAETPAESGPTQ